MAVFAKRTKDPAAVLDYPLDWTDWLTGSEVISTSTWAADAGITIDSDTNTTTSATVWLSAGTSGERYRVSNTVVTDGLRTAVRSLLITVEDR